ncbi:hypothetical protein TTHERM_00765310 (macronuclear) [Tetrahymena thermophila SB210]|uniref:Tetratricopeptide repeat protein n=1 Tax=Tetrahymena thermophila (strain SB210) TaxID=312017 RepID=I7MML6_TETTS|nr:hypothetical protein TTHERM_00765310 [Tetrahymena thermophila SB210]EAS05145.2 hypothetical protein TTHERM_00765310 [Tetrahymena thermophila SB210]|eukprot:XP_001025390.2 hypothetical protein TTHERM_00765310 [Tetrahymena thermophila SB210]
MNSQEQFLDSINELLDKYFQSDNQYQEHDQIYIAFQDLEWEDIFEWANQELLKLNRIKNTTSYQDLNQRVYILFKKIQKQFYRFNEEEKQSIQQIIIIQSLEFLLKNNYKQNIQLCLELTQIIVQKHPKNVEILYLVSSIYYKAKQYEEAMKYLLECKSECQTQIQKQNVNQLEAQIQNKQSQMQNNDSNKQQDSIAQDLLKDSCYIDINCTNSQIDTERGSVKSKKKKTQNNFAIDSDDSSYQDTPEKRKQIQQQSSQQKILKYNDEWEEAEKYGYFKVFVYSYNVLKSKLGTCQKRKRDPKQMFPSATQPTQSGLSAHEISQQKIHNQSEMKSPDKIYRNSRTDIELNDNKDYIKHQEP